MRVVGLAGKVSGPSACERYPQHQVYPYLRRRAAVIEGYSRGCCHGGFPIPWMRVFAWTACKTPWASLVRPTCPTPTRVRNFPATPSRWFCLDAGIAISRDRRVRLLVDNIFVERLWRTIKDEDVDLKGCASLPKLRLGLTEYFAFYNGGRPYQRLGNRTPDVVRRSGAGGGARIVDPRRAKPLQLTQSVPLKLGENCPGQGVHFRQARE